MKNRKTISLTIILIAIILLLAIASKGRGQGLVRPGLIQNLVPAASIAPTSESVAAPKAFNFDSSTDLKEELYKVDPQVLDSDFE